MEIKKIMILSLFSLLMIAGFAFYFIVFNRQQIQGKVIFNTMDEHGCLIHEGYTWNETEQACVREWVLGANRYQNASVSNTTNKTPLKNNAINWTVQFTTLTDNSQNLTENSSEAKNNSGINSANYS